MNQQPCGPIQRMLGEQLRDQFWVAYEFEQCMVTTPMLYPDNTRISLGIAMPNDHRAILTDNGEAWGYASVHGVDESLIKEEMYLTRARFHLMEIEGGELILDVPADRIAEGIFSLATAVQDVAYLVYSARSAHALKELKRTVERV